MSRPLEKEERFADWVDGRMSARDRQRFEAELRVNDELRRQAEEYQRTVELVRRALAEPDADEPVELVDRVMAALPQTQGAGGRLLRGRFGPMLGSMAAAAVLIGGFLFLQNWPSDQAPGRETTTTARRPAEESRDFEVGAVEAERERTVSAFEKGAAAEPPAATGEDAFRSKVQGELGAKRADISAELLNQRDLRLVLDELRATERALQAQEQDRGLAEVQQRLRAALREPGPDPDAGQLRQAAAEPTTEAPPETAKDEGAAKRGQAPQANAPAPGRVAAPQEFEEKLADKTAGQPQPQLEIRQLDQEVGDLSESRTAEPDRTLAYGLPIERSIPVVTVQVDPSQMKGFADSRRDNKVADDFSLGNEAARSGYTRIPGGGWSAFFNDNALAVQARTVTNLEVFSLEQTTTPDREVAGEGILVQAVPPSWVQVAAPTDEGQEQQAQDRKKAATLPSPGFSYVVQGTETEVRDMLANLRLWAERDSRARLDIGQVAEAQVTSALDTLQQQGLASLDRARDAWSAAEQLEVAEPAKPGAAGLSTPGPAGPEQRRARQEAGGRGGERPSPEAPATGTPEPEAVVRRILLVFQEQATTPDPEAAESKK